MDRKALSICAAATASLGAFLCAGCGSESARPATSARMDSPSVVSAPQAVVVSTATDFGHPSAEPITPIYAEEIAADAASVPAAELTADEASASEAVADATAESAPVEAIQGQALAEAPVEAEPLEPLAGESAPVAMSDTSSQPAPFENSEPVAEPAGQTEIRFAVSGSDHAAQKPDGRPGTTMKMEVTESGSTVTKGPAPIAASPGESTASETAQSDIDRPSQAKRSLTPVVVVPRGLPEGADVEQAPSQEHPQQQPTLATKPQAPQAEPAKIEEAAPQIVASEPNEGIEEQAPQATQAAPLPAQAPTIALVEPEPQAEPAPIQPMPVQPAPVAAQPAPAIAPQQIAAQPIAPTAPVTTAMPAMAPMAPSPAMAATLAQVDQRVRHAIQLAEKGALFASRKEFTTAITLIAQARDVDGRTLQNTKAAAAAFRALQEANDFVGNGLAQVEVSRVLPGHQTPVLKQINVSDMPPVIAAQHYYGYAKEQFVVAVGPGPVGSIALYGLAKIIVAGAGQNAQAMQYSGPAMALYQAAVVCEPQNFRAAHELGVLLASSGQLELAREMLLGSTLNASQPTMWKNLAVVQSRLGDQQAAVAAQQRAQVLEQTNPVSKAPPVQWVDPATFASMTPTNDPHTPPPTVKPGMTTPPPAPPVAEPVKAPASTARTRSERFNPLNLRR